MNKAHARINSDMMKPASQFTVAHFNLHYSNSELRGVKICWCLSTDPLCKHMVIK